MPFYVRDHGSGLADFRGSRSGTALAGYRKLYACRKRIRIIYEVEGLKLTVVVVAGRSPGRRQGLPGRGV